MIAAGEDHAAIGLLQAEDVAAFQSPVGLPPTLPSVLGEEEAAQLLIVDHSHVQTAWVLAIDHHAADHAMRKTAVRAGVMVKTVVAGEHSAAIGGQQDALRLARIDEDVVDDHVRRRVELPGGAAVTRLPEAACGAGIDDRGSLRVLLR